MADLATVTSLAEQLIKQLPELYYKCHQELLLNAVNILKELLIVFKNMERTQDNEMKQEIQDEEDEKDETPEDGEIGFHSHFVQSAVIIKVKKCEQEEKQSRLAYEEEVDVPDLQCNSDDDFLPRSSKVVKKKEKRIGSKFRSKVLKDEKSKLEFFKKFHSKEPVMYHCPFCEKNFSSSDNLLSHDKETHMNDVDEYKCPECDFTNSRKTTLQHFAKEHRNRNYKKLGEALRHERKILFCLTCDQLFLKRQTLRKHYLDAHNNWCNDKTCLLCLKEFDSYKDARYHEQVEHNNGKFCCRYRHGSNCDKEFTTYDDLQQHYLIEHPFQETYTCHLCGEFFEKKYRARYLRHIEQHSMTEKSVDCPECDEKFFFEVELKKHMKKHIKKYMCDICDFRTGWKAALEKHIMKHSDERPFVCNICGMAFKWQCSQKKHMLTHSEVRRHKCEYCGKGFKAKKNLNEHTKIHTGKFGGYCEICQKGFTQKYNLTLHNLKHHQ